VHEWTLKLKKEDYEMNATISPLSSPLTETFPTDAERLNKLPKRHRWGLHLTLPNLKRPCRGPHLTSPSPNMPPLLLRSLWNPPNPLYRTAQSCSSIILKVASEQSVLEFFQSNNLGVAAACTDFFGTMVLGQRAGGNVVGLKDSLRLRKAPTFLLTAASIASNLLGSSPMIRFSNIVLSAVIFMPPLAGIEEDISNISTAQHRASRSSAQWSFNARKRFSVLKGK
jgi:hypothetical protein